MISNCLYDLNNFSTTAYSFAQTKLYIHWKELSLYSQNLKYFGIQRYGTWSKCQFFSPTVELHLTEHSAFVNRQIIRLIKFSCNCAFLDNFSALNKCDTPTNVIRQSNENGRCSARLGLAKLMPRREIENVVFLGNTEIFEERKHVAFLGRV